ncbi:hypothetical protein EJ03DRAFT_329811 [Teratosphaeria nubilosa]|uniref:Cyanovirin-N domain-containing protein n=1 Tax=Teratosphaeria nubilosa TaxID=161662 RepID=A0A6G1L1J8_9PEZI|nr:hypothetical protein EJ03DRAFT_329811 [Teratosphaeria nubilosa]
MKVALLQTTSTFLLLLAPASHASASRGHSSAPGGRPHDPYFDVYWKVCQCTENNMAIDRVTRDICQNIYGVASKGYEMRYYYCHGNFLEISTWFVNCVDRKGAASGRMGVDCFDNNGKETRWQDGQ